MGLNSQFAVGVEIVGPPGGVRREARSVYIDASQGALADPAAVDLPDVHHVAYGCRGQGAHHVADSEARIFAAKGITKSERGVINELKSICGQTTQTETSRRPRRSKSNPSAATAVSAMSCAYAGARNQVIVNLMGKRYRLNIGVTAEELKNKLAQVIEMPRPSVEPEAE